jgi:CNT family concentrative nucleoside transporter
VEFTDMTALQAQSGVGLLALCLLAWGLGGFKRGVSARVVVMGLALQITLAAALLHIAPLRAGFAYLGHAVNALAAATQAGTSLVFGYLGGGALPFQELRPGASFILFFQALPLILVVGALSALFYHWGILPAIVRVMAAVLRRLFGIGGAAGFGVAANVFVGMVEAPLMIRAWLARMTRAELFVVMTAGLATISGNTLVVYALMIAPVVPDAAGQLLTASLISAPAAIMAALLMMPAESAGTVPEHDTGAPVKLYDSSMDALVRGTQDGLSLLLGIMASLIVFVVNMALEPATGFTLQRLLGLVLWPVAWAMGVPAAEAAIVASSLGVKIVVNEFVSYLELAQSGGAGLSERSRLILTYALCGFTNFGSVGIMVAGMAGMCPERRADILRLGLPSLVSASIACCMTGAVVGLLTP